MFEFKQMFSDLMDNLTALIKQVGYFSVVC
jgi:hypothetical protein